MKKKVVQRSWSDIKIAATCARLNLYTQTHTQKFSMVKFFQLVLIPKAPLKMEFTLLTFFSLILHGEGKKVYFYPLIWSFSRVFFAAWLRETTSLRCRILWLLQGTLLSCHKLSCCLKRACNVSSLGRAWSFGGTRKNTRAPSASSHFQKIIIKHT